MNKNWPNDAKVGCKAFSNLVNLLDFELNLKQELDEFERLFEWDEWKDDEFNIFLILYIFEMWSYIYCLDIKVL